MPKIEHVDLGSQCQLCGRQSEPNYIETVVVHPGKGLRHRRFMARWCVECIAKHGPAKAERLREIMPSGLILPRSVR